MRMKLIAAVIVGITASGLSGCTTGGTTPESVPPTFTTTAAPVALSTQEIEALLADIEKKVEGTYPGTVGIAVANGKDTAAVGETKPVQAWSSIKVPIAIAAMRNDDYWIDSMNAAIRWSDNDAAINLWFSMPEPKKQVAEILREADGTQKDFIEEVLDPVYEAFGEPLWSVPEQAQFANHLACIDDASEVIDAMGHIDEDQSYGLGTINGAHFKGGWGPDEETGSYSARQFGLIPVAGGKEVAVAVFASADEGDYDTEQKMLSMIAKELKKRGDELPEATCKLENVPKQSSSSISTTRTTTSAR